MVEFISKLIGVVPPFVWIIAILCIALPSMGYVIKKGAKVLAVVIAIAAVLFIYPQWGKSFMNASQLSYDSETGVLTNRDGQQITLKIPKDLLGVLGTSGSEDGSSTPSNAITLDLVLKTLNIKSASDLTVKDVKSAVKSLTGYEITDTMAESILEAFQNATTAQPTSTPTPTPSATDTPNITIIINPTE